MRKLIIVMLVSVTANHSIVFAAEPSNEHSQNPNSRASLASGWIAVTAAREVTRLTPSTKVDVDEELVGCIRAGGGTTERKRAIRCHTRGQAHRRGAMALLSCSGSCATNATPRSSRRLASALVVRREHSRQPKECRHAIRWRAPFGLKHR
jgi:hypothetical protein